MSVYNDLKKKVDNKANKKGASGISSGMMSSRDFVKLSEIDEGATNDTVEDVLGDTANLVSNKAVTAKLNNLQSVVDGLRTTLDELADKGGNPNTLKGMQTLLGRLQADKEVLVKAIDDIRGAHSCADHRVEAPP